MFLWKNIENNFRIQVFLMKLHFLKKSVTDFLAKSLKKFLGEYFEKFLEIQKIKLRRNFWFKKNHRWIHARYTSLRGNVFKKNLKDSQEKFLKNPANFWELFWDFFWIKFWKSSKENSLNNCWNKLWRNYPRKSWSWMLS